MRRRSHAACRKRTRNLLSRTYSSTSRTWRSPRRSESALDFRNAPLVSLIKRPLLDPLRAQQTGLGQDPQVLAGGRLADLQFLRNVDAADAIGDEVAIDLWGEVRTRILQPVENVESPIVGQRLQDRGRRDGRGRQALAAPWSNSHIANLPIN